MAAESGDGTRERVFTVLVAQAGAEQHVWVMGARACAGVSAGAGLGTAVALGGAATLVASAG